MQKKLRFVFIGLAIIEMVSILGDSIPSFAMMNMEEINQCKLRFLRSNQQRTPHGNSHRFIVKELGDGKYVEKNYMVRCIGLNPDGGPILQFSDKRLQGWFSVRPAMQLIPTTKLSHGESGFIKYSACMTCDKLAEQARDNNQSCPCSIQ